MKKCSNCLIPDSVPGVHLGENGLCRACVDYLKNPAVHTALSEEQREKRERDLEQALVDCRGRGQYDCIVPFSGGKDSVYLLYRLRAVYKLKVLAFTSNINLPDIAWANIRRTLEHLDVDHITVSISRTFIRKLFRYLLMHQEARGAVYSVSYVYAPIFEGQAIKLALEKDVPLVLAGYSPGQPEPERMLYEFSQTLVRKVDWTPPHLLGNPEFTEEELACFYNPLNYPVGTEFPRYLAPYHAWKYDQAEIMREVVNLDLVANSKHASPIFSNYPINWLMMYSDLRSFGYNPYAPEFAALIREGKASRVYWRFGFPFIDWITRHKVLVGGQVKVMMKWLDLKDEDLKITLPKGAYDPVLP